jgi:Pyruvate/2-oxoacid:ferredoxin oxidoreductase gamma subunit
MDSIVVRLAGDSGDGVQLMGSQFIASTALSGKDFATFPDYPAEIRAPAGTTFGVSAYQMNIGADPITTARNLTKASLLTISNAPLSSMGKLTLSAADRQQRCLHSPQSDQGGLREGPA